MKKKITGMILIFLLLLGLSSCGGTKARVRLGYPYYYYDSYHVGGEYYDVYKMTNLNDALYYELAESGESTTASYWKVNTEVDLTYQATQEFSQEAQDELYVILKNEISFSEFSFAYSIEKSGEAVLEGDIENEYQEEMHYGVFVAYCSFYLKHDGEAIYLGIPVYEKIIGILDDTIYDPFSFNLITKTKFNEKYSQSGWIMMNE